MVSQEVIVHRSHGKGAVLLATGHTVSLLKRSEAEVRRKKAKIMRRVSFPLQLDLLELVSKLGQDPE